MAMATVIGMWLSAPPSHQINVDGYSLIDLDMSESEVAEILGRPPGSYNRWPLILTGSSWSHRLERDDTTVAKTFCWVSDDAEITIKLNRRGAVFETECKACETMPRSLYRTIGGCFGF
jgi:hypothetical protein